jgi:DNA invertase Pin-like site-specific DNA recombinase
MRTALYCRVSTADQTCENQLLALREHCKLRGWTISTEYVDSGVSGAKERRPQLDAMMRDARRRRFDCVLVWKLDRLGRNTKHLINSLAEFDALGVAFMSLSDSLDMSTPQGRLMFHLLAALAEFERGLITERIHAGVRRAKAQGVHCGRPKGSGAAVIDLSAARTQMAAGASLRAVARSFAVSPSLLCKRLKEVAV